MRELCHHKTLTIFVFTILLIHAQSLLLVKTIARATSYTLFNDNHFRVQRRYLYNNSATNHVRKGIKNMDFKGNRIGAVHGSSNLDFNGKKIHSVNDLLGNDKHSFSSIIRSIGDSNQLLVVLVGIPGSGKSTVALKITNGAYRRWSIACQDVLKSRDKVLEFTSEALMKGDSVIIDRCNFDSVQRRHWTKLADEKQAELQFQYECGKALSLPDNYQLSSTGNTYPRIFKLCLVLPNFKDVEFCANRAFSRGDDGVHAVGTDWSFVCHRMNAEFHMPSIDEENFDALHVCVDENDINRTVCLLTNI